MLFEQLGIEKDKFMSEDDLKWLFNDMLCEYPEYLPLRNPFVMRHIRISAFLWKAFSLRATCI